MRIKAFTLIEVMVVMAIISILAGMMAPAVWKFWESEEIATTKQRLEDLKVAMVGDRTLFQNGVRTHYGFVGDNGELPFGNMSANGGIKYLVSNYNSVYPKWAGPYLKGGFDSSTYMLDAWGKRFEYTPVQVPSGDPHRYVLGEIRSYGPNGIRNNDGDSDYDDIVVNIEEREATAITDKLKGKIPINSVATPKDIWAKLFISYRDATSISGVRSVTDLSCQYFPSVSGSGSFLNYSTVHFQKLPIGKLEYTASIYENAACTAQLSTLESYYFIHDDMKEILLSFPQFNNP